MIVRVCEEGESLGSLVTVQRSTDGGFAVIVRFWKIGQAYFRRRGPDNPVKPRHLLQWDWSERKRESA